MRVLDQQLSLDYEATLRSVLRFLVLPTPIVLQFRRLNRKKQADDKTICWIEKYHRDQMTIQHDESGISDNATPRPITPHQPLLHNSSPSDYVWWIAFLQRRSVTNDDNGRRFLADRHVQFAIEHSAAGHFANAKRHYCAAIELVPSIPKYRHEFGRWLISQREFAAAADEFQTALGLHPDCAECQMGLHQSRLSLTRNA